VGIVEEATLADVVVALADVDDGAAAVTTAAVLVALDGVVSVLAEATLDGLATPAVLAA